MEFEDYRYENAKEADVMYETDQQPVRAKSKKHGTAVKVIALCLACLILGGAAGYGLVKGLEGKTLVLNPTGDGGITAVDTTPAATEAVKTVQTKPAVKATTVPFGGAAQEDGVIIGADYEYLAKTNSIYTGTTLSATDIYDMACNSVVGISTEIDKNVFGQVSNYAVS